MAKHAVLSAHARRLRECPRIDSPLADDLRKPKPRGIPDRPFHVMDADRVHILRVMRERADDAGAMGDGEP